jgi:hypothetical protein
MIVSLRIVVAIVFTLILAAHAPAQTNFRGDGGPLKNQRQTAGGWCQSAKQFLKSHSTYRITYSAADIDGMDCSMAELSARARGWKSPDEIARDRRIEEDRRENERRIEQDRRARDRDFATQQQERDRFWNNFNQSQTQYWNNFNAQQDQFWADFHREQEIRHQALMQQLQQTYTPYSPPATDFGNTNPTLDWFAPPPMPAPTVDWEAIQLAEEDRARAAREAERLAREVAEREALVNDMHGAVNAVIPSDLDDLGFIRQMLTIPDDEPESATAWLPWSSDSARTAPDDGAARTPSVMDLFAEPTNAPSTSRSLNTQEASPTPSRSGFAKDLTSVERSFADIRKHAEERPHHTQDRVRKIAEAIGAKDPFDQPLEMSELKLRIMNTAGHAVAAVSSGNPVTGFVSGDYDASTGRFSFDADEISAADTVAQDVLGIRPPPLAKVAGKAATVVSAGSALADLVTNVSDTWSKPGPVQSVLTAIDLVSLADAYKQEHASLGEHIRDLQALPSNDARRQEIPRLRLVQSQIERVALPEIRFSMNFVPQDLQKMVFDAYGLNDRWGSLDPAR